MTYCLLTGATGLLGSYLIREFLRREQPLAVIVRSSHRESARQRIENIIVRWEKEVGFFLPRPVIFEGELCEPDLGLDGPGRRWIARHCVRVVHSAASLKFQPDDHGEPYRTNVEGTRRVLEFCRAAEISQFHHVSTAYICGLRTGRILENERDVGQQFGNAYEETKIVAEKMVLDAGFPVPPTIYRPAIIVGDSRTGYTSTFHGFYAPLRLIAPLLGRLDLSEGSAWPLVSALGMTGNERKNFVPVDWVAAVIAHILAHPELHGQCYHLAPRHPARVATMTETLIRLLREERGSWSSPARNSGQPGEDAQAGLDLGLADFGERFRAQMEVYKAYWRDDPEFDLTNTTAAAPHLPAPEVDHAMLRRIAAYAFRVNFGWPNPPSVKPEFDVHNHLVRWLQNGSGSFDRAGRDDVLGLQVNGPGGGQWELLLDGQRPIETRQGITSAATASFYMNSKTFQRIAAGRIAAGQAITTGQAIIEGCAPDSRRLEMVLQAIATEGCGLPGLRLALQRPH